MSRQRFEGKVCVITGAARGIGKNIARKFCEEGAFVVICDIDRAQCEQTLSEFKTAHLQVECLFLDLSRKGQPKKMIQEVVERYHRLDVLVNNARSGRKLEFLEETEETFEEGLAVTLKAAFFSSQEAIRVMKEKGEGSIINISSVSALYVSNESAHYQIAKAGLLQMTRYLAVQFAKSGIRANAVLPGFIVQDEHAAKYCSLENAHYREVAEFSQPLGRIGHSDEVADVVLYLSSQEASFVTGQCLTVDGGLTFQDPSTLLYQFDKSQRIQEAQKSAGNGLQ